MPRRPRVFVSGAVYHIYCRVARGEAVFSDAREAAALVGVIRGVAREHGLSVLAWCVMATHYHLAVRVGRIPLWRSMRLIQGRFARSHSRRRRVLGPFWQGRYKAIVVPDARYLEQVIAYIHLNPVMAKVVSDPARYRWSGHRELLGRVAEPLVDVHEALVGTVPGIKFGFAFCESSGPRLVRYTGTDDELIALAKKNALALAAGHAFILFLGNAYPINILRTLRDVPEIVRFFCATANPVEVIVAETKQGRGVLGVIDGWSTLGVEKEKDIAERKEFLRKIGYKLG